MKGAANYGHIHTYASFYIRAYGERVRISEHVEKCTQTSKLILHILSQITDASSGAIPLTILFVLFTFSDTKEVN